MAESKFKIGDTVQLKSGGPSMTVRSIEKLSDSDAEWNEIKCDWFDSNKKEFVRGSFKEEMLNEFKASYFI